MNDHGSTRSFARTVLALAALGGLAISLAGCSAASAAEGTATKFVQALAGKAPEDLCQYAVLGGQPITGDKERERLCAEVLAPNYASLTKEQKKQLANPEITANVNGDKATVKVDGFPNDLNLLKIDGDWLVVIG